MKKPLIALTMDQSPATDARPFGKGVPLNYINADYIRYIEKADMIPMVLPTLSNLSLIAEIVARIDGLLLTGGDDVYAEVYGEKVIPGDWRIDAPRTFMEIALIKEARKQNKPVYAICRGCQMLNVAMGGTLYQDVTQQVQHAIQHRSLEKPNWNSHEIQIKEDSLLYKILRRKRYSVNTSHHQAIKDLAHGLRVAATAADGIIEAIEDPQTNFFLGVQWHPETMKDDTTSLELLKAFIEQCGR